MGTTNGQASGYAAYYAGDGGRNILSANGLTAGSCCANPGSTWHTYRFDVNGPNLTFYIDGGVVASEQDATLLTTTGQIGLGNTTGHVLYIRSIVVKGL
jgi:hypothetical protein